MIVQPDFLEHWKTSLLIELLDDKCAPLYVIRLWGHCQNRKTHRFPRVSPSITKAICKAPHDAEKFENAMIDSGFIRIEGGDVVAHEWDVINASLIANWENGKKGGRPPKKTHKKPIGNPDVTDKRREEKIDDTKAKEKTSNYDLVKESFCKITGQIVNVISPVVYRQMKTLFDSGFKLDQFEKVFENSMKDEYLQKNKKMRNIKRLTEPDEFQAFLSVNQNNGESENVLEGYEL
jgi:hypothetical protein